MYTATRRARLEAREAGFLVCNKCKYSFHVLRGPRTAIASCVTACHRNKLCIAIHKTLLMMFVLNLYPSDLSMTYPLTFTVNIFFPYVIGFFCFIYCTIVCFSNSLIMVHA